MIPFSWRDIPAWQRQVATEVNPILQGYPLMKLAAAPPGTNDGFLFYDTTVGAPRWYEGAYFTVASLDAVFDGATFDLTDNTLTGTKSEFDAACSDGNFLYSGVAISVTTISATAITASSLAATGAITSSGGGVGYATGAGGTVTQNTNKSTAVTLDKLCGTVTMNNASLNADTSVSFTLNNSTIAATDNLILNHKSGGTIGAYHLNAACGAGSASITVTNRSTGALGEAVVIAFTVLKGVTS